MSVFNRRKNRETSQSQSSHEAYDAHEASPKKPKMPSKIRRRTQIRNANGDVAPSTRTKIRRFLYKLKHDLISFDGIAFGIVIVLTLAWTWGAISSLSRNWQLAQTVESKRKELALLRLEVGNSELENEYYKSAEYQELAARAKQNKVKDGEALVYLPANSESAKTKHRQSNNSLTEAADASSPSNFSQWLAFLFGT